MTDEEYAWTLAYVDAQRKHIRDAGPGLADSPLACIRCARTASDESQVAYEAVTAHDLLDANESTWAFVFVGGVGWNGTLLVKSLVGLASIDGCRSYCGRTADEHGGLPARHYTGKDRAGPLPAHQSRRRHGIASAHPICPSKPSDLAMLR